MKVLLIQPSEGHAFGLSKVFLPEPLGLELVGTVLRQAGHEVVLLDLRLEARGYLESVLKRWQPEAIGIACSFTSELVRAKQIAQKVRRLATRAFLFVGGHHASRTPEDFQRDDADAIVLGEAEIAVVPLLEAVERGAELSTVPSLALPTPQGLRRTAGPIDANFLDLEKLPRPDRTLVARYRQRYHIGFARPVFSVETTRGCPYTCNFCSVWEMYARSYRTRTPERVVADLADCDGEEIFFTDDLFFLDAKRALALGEAVRAAKLKKVFTAQIRADSIAKHPEIVPLWREAGLERVFIGMEAVDEAGLLSVDKRSHIEHTEKAIEVLSKHGVEIQGSFIAMPEWGPEDFERLSEYVRTRPLTYVSFAVLTPLPGTKLHRERYHDITSHDPELYDVFHTVLPTKLSLEDFYREFAGLYRKAYSRGHVLKMILSATKALARGDFLHLYRVAKQVRHLTSPDSYMIAHREAAKRARRGTSLRTGIPPVAAPVVEEVPLATVGRGAASA